MRSRTSLHVASRFVPLALLVLSILGFADATYLTERYYSGLAVGCVALGGCEQVTGSQYATIGDVPVALLGAGYYLIILGLVALYFFLSREQKSEFSRIADGLLNFAAKFTVVGFLVSLWFVYLQLFVIQSICTYCMISAATSTLLFLSGMILLHVRRAMREEEVTVG
ncbi:vitamin K epoxide reductase family protein [Candidatus Wolfebacteria bacterium]|nr:vitamin K epoxide reductase family protein [Candidatus Wolfebacteria bacterium]